MAKYGWLDLVRDEVNIQNMKATRRTARATEQIAQDQPRLAYEQGWREGWTAGYRAAMEKMKGS